MHEANVYVFTYESIRENYYGKHMWDVDYDKAEIWKDKQKIKNSQKFNNKKELKFKHHIHNFMNYYT